MRQGSNPVGNENSSGSINPTESRPHKTTRVLLVASLLLVAMPGAPSCVLLRCKKTILQITHTYWMVSTRISTGTGGPQEDVPHPHWFLVTFICGEKLRSFPSVRSCVRLRRCLRAFHRSVLHFPRAIEAGEWLGWRQGAGPCMGFGWCFVGRATWSSRRIQNEQ